MLSDENRDRVVHVTTSSEQRALHRRTVLATLGAAAGSGVLAGCATGGPSTTAPAAALAPVTLRYAAPFAPSTQVTVEAGRGRIVDAFNTRGPVQVRLESPQNIYVAVLAQAAAGDPPDLCHTLPREYHPFVNAGALLELDPLMKRDRRDVADIVPTVLNDWVRDGHNWGLPQTYPVQALYFNRALFDKQGVQHPDQLEKDGKWTFDAYLDAARKLTTGTGETKVWGGFWPNTTLDIQVGFFWSFGGDLWDRDLKAMALDTKESLAAIQFQADLTNKYGVSPTADERKQLPSGNGGTLAAERAPMEILMTGAVGQITPTTFPKGMVPLPKGPAGRFVRSAGQGVQMMKGAKNHEAAWQFTSFQTSVDAEKIMYGLRLSLAWHKGSLGSPDYARLLLPWESAAAYAECVNRGRPTRFPGQFTAINALYEPAFDAVRHGKKGAAQAMAEIKSEVNALMAKSAAK